MGVVMRVTKRLIDGITRKMQTRGPRIGRKGKTMSAQGMLKL